MDRYGGAAYGGSSTARGGRGESAVLVPGFDAAYYVSSVATGTAYGHSAYGGRRDVVRPGAGLFAAPDPDAGAITAPWWWAFADSVTVARIDPDGTRVPVRQGEGLTPAGPSRRNPQSNPAARDSVEGYTPGPNTAPLTRTTGLTGPVQQVSTAVRATTTAAGSASVVASLDPVGALPTTFGFETRTSAVSATLGLSVAWFDASSASLGSQAYPVAAAIRTAAADGLTWTTVTVDTWPAGAVLGVVSHLATGLPAGGWLEVTARIAETGSALSGPYFDGDSLAGATWTGTPGLSYSVLGQINTLVDAEAPLDVAVAYELTSPAAPGWVARSEPVTLPSQAVFAAAGDLWHARRPTLLTHPGQDRTIRVWIRDAPPVENPLEQQVFSLPGRRRKVVISAGERGGDEGELTFMCETHEERARLHELLQDGSPLLLRMPGRFGYPPLWWLKFGGMTTTPLQSDATNPRRWLTLPFVEVDRPSVATRPVAA